MPTSERTIAELMKSNGYTTGHIGKWHLGYTPETMPNGQGFDYSFGHMGGCIDNYSHFFYWVGPNRHDLWKQGKEIWRDGEYFGDMMVDECKGFVSRNKNNPFFVYWAINWPTIPLEATDKWRLKYKDLPSRDKYAAFMSPPTSWSGGCSITWRKRAREHHRHLSVRSRTFGGGANLWRGGAPGLTGGTGQLVRRRHQGAA